MQQALSVIEEILAEQGWDQPPQLTCLLGERGEGQLLLHGVPLPLQPLQLKQPTGVAVQAIGATIRESLDFPRLRDQFVATLPADISRRFVGVSFHGEGWAPPKGQEGRAFDRPYADVPGGREVRFLHVVDAAGRYHVITRYRGKEPQAHTITHDNDKMVMVGRIANGLRDIVYALGRMLAFGTVDLDAVDKIGRGEPPDGDDSFAVRRRGSSWQR